MSLHAVNVFQIKRHLWRDNQSLFGDEVSPLLSQYIKDKENVLFSHEVGPGTVPTPGVAEPEP
jgi:hypothetical protein